MLNKNKFLSLLTLTAFAIILQINNLWAQCPMCKASAEANLREGGTAALGLNTGIFYLFFTPYILMGILGYLWWTRNYKPTLAEEKQFFSQQKN